MVVTNVLGPRKSLEKLSCFVENEGHPKLSGRDSLVRRFFLTRWVLFLHVTETDEVRCEVCYYCHLGMPSRWGKLRAQHIIRHDSLCDSLRERGTRGNTLFLASRLGGVDGSAS